MRKFIIFILILLPMVAVSQTRQSTPQAVKVFGIPLGITADEFNNKAKVLNDSLANMLHVKEASVFLTMYEGYTGDKIVWQAFAKAKNNFLSPSVASSRVIAVLSAKYGAPNESMTCDGIKSLRWDFKGGYIQVWNELLYGDKKETFYMQFVDYTALKKAEPELYKDL